MCTTSSKLDLSLFQRCRLNACAFGLHSVRAAATRSQRIVLPTIHLVDLYHEIVKETLTHKIRSINMMSLLVLATINSKLLPKNEKNNRRFINKSMPLFNPNSCEIFSLSRRFVCVCCFFLQLLNFAINFCCYDHGSGYSFSSTHFANVPAIEQRNPTRNMSSQLNTNKSF